MAITIWHSYRTREAFFSKNKIDEPYYNFWVVAWKKNKIEVLELIFPKCVWLMRPYANITENTEGQIE